MVLSEYNKDLILFIYLESYLVGQPETDLYYMVFNFILLMKDVTTRYLAKKPFISVGMVLV